MDWRPRLAREDDIPALEALIPISTRTLQAPHYSPAQMEAALGPVFGVDRQLIRDGTYFVVECDGQIVGCGGWSKRDSLFGGDSGRSGDDALLNPECDSAGILAACESAIQAAGFHSAELVATLAGELFYAAFDYSARERYEIPMSADLTLPVVRMTKHFGVV